MIEAIDVGGPRMPVLYHSDGVDFFWKDWVLAEVVAFDGLTRAFILTRFTGEGDEISCTIADVDYGCGQRIMVSELKFVKILRVVLSHDDKPNGSYYDSGSRL